MAKSAGILSFLFPSLAASAPRAFVVLLLTASLASCDGKTRATGQASGSADATASHASAAAGPAGKASAKKKDGIGSLVGMKYAAARRTLTDAGFTLLEVASESSTVAGDKAACPADTQICTVQWVDNATRALMCVQVQVTRATAESDWPVTDQKGEKCYE